MAQTLFHYQQDARGIALGDIKAGAVFLLISSAIFFFTIRGYDDAIFLLPFFIILWLVNGIFCLVGAVFFIGGIARMLTGGEWNITLTETAIDWQTPPLAEKSFQVQLNEIVRIVRRVRIKPRKDGSLKKKTSYTLETRSNDKIGLSDQSKLDLEVFIELLREQGVELEEKQVADK